MTIEEVKKHDYIYGFFFANPNNELKKVKLFARNTQLEDDRILEFYDNSSRPHAIYYLKDYKRTWCFEPEEIPNAPVWEI